MSGRNIIVVGASAGGVGALRELIRGLPRDLPAAIFIVLHVPEDGTSSLPEILSRAGSLPVAHPLDGDPIEQGHVYVAPPDRHLLVTTEIVRLSRGPRQNRHRPSIDPLFRSAAKSYGNRVVGVILTGALDDGAGGLADIKKAGGIAIVQDPHEAEHASMPRAAIANTAVDYTVPVAAMPALLMELAATPVLGAVPTQEEGALDERALQAKMEPDPIGSPSVFACPDCNGVLWEIDDKGPLRFRCRTGHAYAAESLIAQQEESLENSLWAAVRALEETSELQQRVAERLRRASPRSSERMHRRAAQALRQAEAIRGILERAEPGEVDMGSELAHTSETR